MWRNKSCIIEMFLAFYETHHRPDSSYRDFLQEVLSVYEEWKNARVPLEYLKRFAELANATETVPWFDEMFHADTAFVGDALGSVLKAEPVEVCYPADKENDTNPLFLRIPDCSLPDDSCSSPSASMAGSDSGSGLCHEDTPPSTALLSRRRWKRTDALSCSEGGFRCATCHRRFRSAGLLERHRVRHQAAGEAARCAPSPPRRSPEAACAEEGREEAVKEEEVPLGAGPVQAEETAMEVDAQAKEGIKVEQEAESEEESSKDGDEEEEEEKVFPRMEIVFPGLVAPSAPSTASSSSSAATAGVEATPPSLVAVPAPAPALDAQTAAGAEVGGQAEVPSNVLTNSLQHNLPGSVLAAAAYQMPSGPSRRCPVCGKGISNKNNWERHLLIHTGVKPFKCRHCGKAFNRKDNLATHEKKHAKHMQQQLQQHHQQLQHLHQHQQALQQQQRPQSTQQQQPQASPQQQHRQAANTATTTQEQQQPQASPQLQQASHQQPQQPQQPQQRLHPPASQQQQQAAAAHQHQHQHQAKPMPQHSHAHPQPGRGAAPPQASPLQHMQQQQQHHLHLQHHQHHQHHPHQHPHHHHHHHHQHPHQHQHPAHPHPQHLLTQQQLQLCGRL